MFTNKGKGGGRLGNAFIRNMTVHLLSKKYNMGCEYEPSHIFNDLGIFFENSLKPGNKSDISEATIKQYLNNEVDIDESKEYIFENCYCQDPEIVKHIIMYFDNPMNKICIDVSSKNIFRSRYNNNNDIFVHIRAGDIFMTPDTEIVPYENYYDMCIERINKNYNKIFIASDNLEHRLCKSLINKYNMIPCKEDECGTIMFGITCKYVITSAGSFSLLLALLSNASSTVFFDDNAGRVVVAKELDRWHPDYFKELGKINMEKFILVTSKTLR